MKRLSQAVLDGILYAASAVLAGELEDEDRREDVEAAQAWAAERSQGARKAVSKKAIKKTVERPTGGHTWNGNCWDNAYRCRKCVELCDVCHRHDQPRGECDDCPRCPTCDRIDDADAQRRREFLEDLRKGRA